MTVSDMIKQVSLSNRHQTAIQKYSDWPALLENAL